MILFILQDGNTPFQAACQEGHLDIAQTLIFNGANVNHTNKVCYSYSTGPGIYGSKLTRVQGQSLRTRAVYVAINPWQPCYN